MKEFWLDTNLSWGTVSSATDWQTRCIPHQEYLKERTPEWLTRAARATAETQAVERGERPAPPHYTPNFGLYSEHVGELTLYEWAKQHGFLHELVGE